jgi:hypothetical protein
VVSSGRLTLNNKTEGSTGCRGKEKKIRSKCNSKKWHLPTMEGAIFLNEFPILP